MTADPDERIDIRRARPEDGASLGEVSDVYRQVFGLYREPIIF